MGAVSPPPASVDELASEMTAAVVGRYVKVDEVVWGPNSPQAEARGHDESLPRTVLEFAVDSYIVGSGDHVIPMSWYGDWDDPEHLYGVPRPVLDEEVTLVIRPRGPDNETFIPILSYASVVEKDDRVAWAFVDGPAPGIVETFDDPPPFAAGMTMDEFHEALRAAARERGLVVPVSPASRRPTRSRRGRRGRTRTGPRGVR